MRQLLTVAIIFLVAAFAGLGLLYRHGYRLLSVQTGSMLPDIRPGDALVIQPVRRQQLHLGDIISYHSWQNSRVVITHRLVGTDAKSGWLKTQGDNLPRPDPAFSPRMLSGRAVAVAPKLGLVLDALRHPLWLATLIYAPVFLIVYAEAARLVNIINEPIYRLQGY